MCDSFLKNISVNTEEVLNQKPCKQFKRVTAIPRIRGQATTVTTCNTTIDLCKKMIGQ